MYDERDFATIRTVRSNHKGILHAATIPVRDPLWQSTLDGQLIPHRKIKKIRKQYNFLTIEEFSISRNKSDRR